MKTIITCCAALVLGAASAFAAAPFVATATTTDAGTPVTLQAEGANFFDFLDTLITTEGSFSQLDNRPYNARMSFLGVGDAIRFTTNAAGTSVTLTLAPTGFSRTFTGPTADAVDDALEAFFERDGQQVIADFLKAVAKTSPIAVTDGNPTSATAIAASSSFTGQGFTGLDELNDSSDPSGANKPKFGGISFGLNAGSFEAGGFEGKVYDLSATVLNFGGETVRLIVPLNANFLELDGGSKVAGAGISMALPIRLKKMNKELAFNWRVTPMLGASVRGSADLASVSPLMNLGVVNTVDYRVSPKYVLSMVNQLTLHKSIAVAFDDFDFDPKIDQQILKNGFRLTTPFSRRVIADAFVVHTNFLKDAAVKQFWTIGGSVAFRATQRWNLVLGLNRDTGDNFKAFSVGLSSAWKW